MRDKGNRLGRRTGGRAPVRSRPAPAAAGRFHRADQAEGEPGHRHRGGAPPRRCHGPRAALRPAGPGQDHARHHHRRANSSVGFEQTSGPVLQKKLDLTGILSNIRAAPGVLHRRDPPPAAGRRGDALLGAGGFPHRHPHRHRAGRAHHSMPIPRFTAIGATTRQGLVSAPLRGRFGLVLRLNHYDVDGADADRACARRDCWTWPSTQARRRGDRAPQPRHAAHRQPPAAPRARLRRRCAPTATSTWRSPQTALDLLEVDRFGLDEIDQKIMLTVLEKYGGGPVGLNTIAASIDEEPDTIEEVYEPYLIQLGFLDRTPRGRVGDRARVRVFRHRRAACASIAGQPVLTRREESSSISRWDRISATASGTCEEAIDLLRGPDLRCCGGRRCTRPSRGMSPDSRGFSTWWWKRRRRCSRASCWQRAQRIESETRAQTDWWPKGPRTIDIDICFIGRIRGGRAGPGDSPPAHGRAPFRAGAAGRTGAGPAPSGHPAHRCARCWPPCETR